MRSKLSTLAAGAVLTAALGATHIEAQTIPVWPGLYSSEGTTYVTVMLGDFPIPGGTTTIPIVLIPLRLNMGFVGLDGVVFDPLKVESNGDSATSFVLKSPLFMPTRFPEHPETDKNPTQYLDAYQRANFWNIVTGSTDPTAPVKNDFHVLLGWPLTYPRTLNVPIGSGFWESDGNGELHGHLDWAYFENALDNLLEVSDSHVLTIILLNRVSFYNQNGEGASHTSGGFHNIHGDKLFVVAGFDFKNNDVALLGHELAESLVDPLQKSTAPGWVHNGSCADHMEVGDPMHGHFIEVPLNGNTFHLEDLAFEAWFARGEPSKALDGRRTFFGEDIPNPPCN